MKIIFTDLQKIRELLSTNRLDFIECHSTNTAYVYRFVFNNVEEHYVITFSNMLFETYVKGILIKTVYDNSDVTSLYTDGTTNRICAIYNSDPINIENLLYGIGCIILTIILFSTLILSIISY